MSYFFREDTLCRSDPTDQIFAVEFDDSVPDRATSLTYECPFANVFLGAAAVSETKSFFKTLLTYDVVLMLRYSGH